MSHTHTAPRFAASKFKIRIRVGSASALNHPAYSRARPRLSFGPASVLQHSPPPFAQSVMQFVFCAIESVASQFLSHLTLLHSSTNVNVYQMTALIRDSAKGGTSIRSYDELMSSRAVRRHGRDVDGFRFLRVWRSLDFDFKPVRK